VPPNMDSFSTRDLQFIVKFHAEFSGDQFRHLVHAICPSIYGHEFVKVRPLSDFKKMGQSSAHMHALLVVEERYFVLGHVAPACHAIYELGHRGQPWTRPGLSLHRWCRSGTFIYSRVSWSQESRGFYVVSGLW
jgi:hypothetical protein